MSIDLYPHNQKALEAAYKSWESGNRCCAIIHPPGTGKSFIYHKLIEENTSKRFLVLAPTNYIFQNQELAIKRHVPEIDLSNVKTKTYISLANEIKAKKFSKDQFDYIILDEFHRGGAPYWELGVRGLFKNNPKARVLGLTATPLRYSDMGRNMAKEFFHNNIVSEITIVEAITKGLLPTPRYFVGEYSHLERLESYEKRLHTVASHKKEEIKKILKAHKRGIVSGAKNINEIFKDAKIKSSGKYIVFCRNGAELEQSIKNVPEWFDGINDNVHTYKVYSYNKKKDFEEPAYSGKNELELKAFDDDADKKALKLLFCIDALKEGVHPNGVDGVIFLRHTSSPGVFLQQLGRGLDTKNRKERPLIIDLVGNLEDLELVYTAFTGKRATIKNFGGVVEAIPFFELSKRLIENQKVYDKLNKLFSRLDTEEKILFLEKRAKENGHV